MHDLFGSGLTFRLLIWLAYKVDSDGASGSAGKSGGF